jgi:biotin carboxyl carrier protein
MMIPYKQEVQMDTYIVRINGTEYEVEIEKKAGTGNSGPGTTSAPQGTAAPAGGAAPAPAASAGTASGDPVVCGTAGKVWKIEKNVGDQVSEGDSVLILEAMKMEIPVVAPKDGTVSMISVQEGDAVASGQTVAYVE